MWFHFPIIKKYLPFLSRSGKSVFLSIDYYNHDITAKIHRTANNYINTSCKLEAVVGICSPKNFAKCHRKTPVLDSLFNKSFIEKRLQRWCFPMKFAKFSRTLLVAASGKSLGHTLVVNF